jgi:hypothetical protein
MTKLRKVGTVAMSIALFLVLSATAAFAQTSPAEVRTEVIDEATPYFTVLIGIVVALFGLALLVTLARKAAGMAKGGIRKG